MKLQELDTSHIGKKGYVITCQTVEDYNYKHKFKGGIQYFIELPDTANSMLEASQQMYEKYRYQLEKCNYVEIPFKFEYQEVVENMFHYEDDW